MTITKIRKRQIRKQRPDSVRPSPPSRPQPIITWAESAECTCPDQCERDHEQD
jgi:hypothetical protein